MSNRRMLMLWLVTLAIACGAALGMVSRDEDPAPARLSFGPIRGMTVSCHGIGQSWGSDAMVETMRELRDLGVTWIAIHPYARIGGDGSVGSSGGRGRSFDPSWVRRPIEAAKDLGLRVMIKPHLAYWGSPFSWRGVIRFEDEETWARFFREYTAWIQEMASLSEGADAFVVGTELDQTIQHEAAWRSIITTIRAELPETPLTYAANWDQYQRVPFWDALDAIGVQGYFPLVAHAEAPEAAELAAGWAARVAELDRFRATWNRPVVLTELGYDDGNAAARTPWASRSRGSERNPELQQQCLTAALAAVDAAPGIEGAFLWKWFPGSSQRGDFLKSTPAMRAVLAAQWGPPPAPAED